jgi:hypothetical protein
MVKKTGGEDFRQSGNAAIYQIPDLLNFQIFKSSNLQILKIMAFKNQLSVMPHNGGFAVAIDRVPTGQIFDTKAQAQDEVTKIRSERRAKREAAK